MWSASEAKRRKPKVANVTVLGSRAKEYQRSAGYCNICTGAAKEDERRHTVRHGKWLSGSLGCGAELTRRCTTEKELKGSADAIRHESHEERPRTYWR
jgi:hypothetical protein